MGSMEKKSKRFEPVKKIAANKETAAAIRVNQSVVEQEASLEQLTKLKEYRDGYVAEFKLKGQSGMSASRLLEYQAFVHKLNLAIDEQMRAVQSMKLKVSEHQLAFRKSNTRKKVVEKLIENSKLQEIKEEGRKEQNEADDRVFKGQNLN
jgi:flagellar FliJ protein